jgi:hypothetical protein
VGFDDGTDTCRDTGRGRSATDGLWVLALFGLLAVPDICAALDDPQRTTSGAQYKAWFKANLGDKYPDPQLPEVIRAEIRAGRLPGDPDQPRPDLAHELYKIPCSMLHEGAFLLPPGWALTNRKPERFPLHRIAQPQRRTIGQQHDPVISPVLTVRSGT